MDRRDFLGLAATGIGALTLGMRNCNSPQAVAPSDWVNLGVIGIGSRGQHMMRMMLRVPGVRIIGLCDIYEPKDFRGPHGYRRADPGLFRRSKMLEARNIDAVMVSTPLGLHAEHVTASLDSGRAVYGEKSMGRTLEDCNRIRDEVRRTGKIFQVGLQFTYAPWYQDAQRRIRDGRIGQVTHIHAYWHRNNNGVGRCPRAAMRNSSDC